MDMDVRTKAHSQPREHTSSYCQTIVGPKPKPTVKQLPIVKHMLRAYHSKNREALFGGLKKIVGKEIKQLSKNTSLRDPVNIDSPIVSYESVDEEVKEYAPTFKAILEGACPTATRFRTVTKRFKRCIRNKSVQLSLIAIAMQARNQQCNRLQKFIGLNLWKTESGCGNFEMLQKLGMCCSLRTIELLVDQNQDYPPEKRQKIQATPRKKKVAISTKTRKKDNNLESENDESTESEFESGDSEEDSVSLNDNNNITKKNSPMNNNVPEREENNSTVYLTDAIKIESAFEPEDIECIDLSSAC